MINRYSRLWIELNRSALIHNIVQLKRAIHPAYLAPVIKCNAYGHGLIQIAQICDERPEVFMLCVAFLSEALQLREARITKPILVMSYCDDDIAKAINKNIAIVIDSHEELHHINTIGAHHKYRFDVHIKLETGLVRRGVEPEQIDQFVLVAQQLPYVRIMGLCSHFASVYTPKAPITTIQIERFNQAIRTLAHYSLVPPLLHIGNSSLCSALGGNMFRVGLALYGYNPMMNELNLKPVLYLKSRITLIRNVNEGVSVGYDGLCTTLRKSTIALIPVGYADGYDMRLSNCCVVHVRGLSAPVFGRVGMNFIAIDITDILNATVGDEVLLIGDKPEVRITDLIASASMKNPREILARLNPLLPRYIV